MTTEDPTPGEKLSRAWDEDERIRREERAEQDRREDERIGAAFKRRAANRRENDR